VRPFEVWNEYGERAEERRIARIMWSRGGIEVIAALPLSPDAEV
jgi:hypothetical protein